MVENWVAQCRTGDRDAFASLVGAFQQKVFGLCWQFLRDRQAAMDAAADIFCKVYAAFDQYDSDRSFAAWILAIATNHLLQIKRTERRQGVRLEWSGNDVADERATPEEELLNFDDREKVEAALARIPDRYRLVLYLRYYEDLSYEEISGVLDTSVSTVGSLVLRAKGIMRKELALLGRTG